MNIHPITCVVRNMPISNSRLINPNRILTPSSLTPFLSPPCPSLMQSTHLFVDYNRYMKYSQTQLRSQLMRETVNETTLYYSLVKKQAKTMSFLSNERLLVYDATRRILFYNNDYKNTPFRTSVPEPKNNVSTPLQSSTFKNPSGTNEIQVRHTGKNGKGEIETVEWNFTCETPDLAKEWMKLFEDEKERIVNQITGQKGGAFLHDTLLAAIQPTKQENPLRESILKPEEQAPPPLQEQPEHIRNSKMSDPRASQLRPSPNDSLFKSQKDPMKEPSKDPSRNNINESRISIDPSQNESKFREDPSRSVKHSQSKSSSIDWNLKFLQDPSEHTLLEFQQAAVSAMNRIWERDSRVQSDPRRVYEEDGMIITACGAFSKEAGLLKRQFRNYHFILESCKNKLGLGVPLSCLIEWQGAVVLAKAAYPLQATEVKLNTVLQDIRELQRYTRVSNSVLDRAVLLDLSEVYGRNGDKRLIYVDDLTDYLPLHTEEDMSRCSLRPEYLLDHVGQVLPGGEVRQTQRAEWKTLTTACEALTPCITSLVSILDSQQQLWVNALQLKQLFHSNGVNLKSLPRVYSLIQNKQVRKYVHSVMAAKVAKDSITETLAVSRKEGRQVNSKVVVEECLRLLLEGNNSASSQAWKDLSLRFKKQFGLPLNHGELLGGFFLNSLLGLLRVKCQPSRLAKNKKLFRQEGVILSGFVVAVQPKVKSYCRFTTELVEKIRYACRQEKKSPEVYEEIIEQLKLSKNALPPTYALNDHSNYVLEYLSYYTPPVATDSNAPLGHLPIYAQLLHQPPSSFSLRITKNYLQWCTRKDRGDEFKKTMQGAVKVADFWLEESHLHHCDLYELLSDYYAAAGSGEESVNFMKESLSRCIRACGAGSKQAGSKYYELGERELKVGRKRQALENFSKAKLNMEANKNTGLKYPQLLMRLASLHLNSGNVEGCIEGCMQAIKNFEEYDKRSGSAGLITEGYKIKTFQVQSRAYQISGRKDDLRDMAVLCARKFNRTRSEWAYEQMLRICLAAAIFKNPINRCEVFLDFSSKLTHEEGEIEVGEALRGLMSMSETIVVMERFLSRFDQIERLAVESSSKKSVSQDTRDFAQICKYLGCIVGEDYIAGLVHQKQYD